MSAEGRGARHHHPGTDAVPRAHRPIYNYAIKGGFPNDNGAITGLGELRIERADLLHVLTSHLLATPGWNLGGINGSGQVPAINGLPTLIDKDTPADAMSRTGFDGDRYNLVFSDEFNVDGRTFWPGDDPWWEAVDLHYWGTVDLEWYDPGKSSCRAWVRSDS